MGVIVIGVGQRIGYSEGFEQKLLPKNDQIQRLGIHVPVKPDIIVFVADPAKREHLPVDFKPADFALAVALLSPAGADETSRSFRLAVDELVQIEPRGFNESRVKSLRNFQGHSEGAHESGVGRNDDVGFHKRRHGNGDRAVIAYSALHEDLLPHRPGPFHAVQVIEAHRIHQSG